MIDVIKVQMKDISLQQIFIGVNIFLMPLFYVKFFKNWEFRSLFMLSQVLYVISHFAKYGLALRWFKDWADEFWVYFFCATFAENIERGLTIIPSFIIMAKLIPQGVESSMLSFSNTIISLN